MDTNTTGNSTKTNSTNVLCPDTHFQCPDNGYCLPVLLRCNGVFDCPYHEDEADCETYTCPGFYRCRGSKVCLHPDNVCDGFPHCPEFDDELLCNFTCPVTCVCYGHAFFCPRGVSSSDYPSLRYLHADASNMTLSDLQSNPLLVYLSLSRCGLTDSRRLGESRNLPNLLFLDLSYNHFTNLNVTFVYFLKQLRNLSLTGNPVTTLFGR
jgi:hypothetical protein